jgi:hypothetical protein
MVWWLMPSYLRVGIDPVGVRAHIGLRRVFYPWWQIARFELRPVRSARPRFVVVVGLLPGSRAPRGKCWYAPLTAADLRTEEFVLCEVDRVGFHRYELREAIRRFRPHADVRF